MRSTHACKLNDYLAIQICPILCGLMPNTRHFHRHGKSNAGLSLKE